MLTPGVQKDLTIKTNNNALLIFPAGSYRGSDGLQQ